MGVEVTALKRLSTLLDEALELDERGRESWLAGLGGDDAPFVPRLRELLARHDLASTDLFAPPAWIAGARAAAPGDTVGAYRLLREIGTGGMSAVWLAERGDGQLARKVALKLPHIGWSPAVADRFAREREILASLEHPHIARLYDVGTDAQGRPYMALEYVEGEPIDVHCRRHALSVAERLVLLLQAADAVAFAHSRLVIHRDLKPANILVTTQGQVRLLDFGIAKLMEGDRAQETALTRVSGRALTRDYASPEQIRGEPVGTASDVYSLGVVAYELLAGVRPYRLEHASAAALEEAIVAAEVPLASALVDDPVRKAQLRGDLDAILHKALKKLPAERYATVDALAQEWRRHLDGQRVLARADTLRYRAARFLRRWRLPLAIGALTALAFGLALGVGATSVVILALLLGLSAALWQARLAQGQARLARREATTSKAVQEFLEGLFRVNARDQPDPMQARQRTAKELLDEGSRRIDSALADAPEARFKLLATLADMYVDLGEPTRAVELAAQRAALAERVYGPRTSQHAQALVAWGVTLIGAEQHAVARDVLLRADAALDALKDSDAELRLDVELALGELYRYVRDPKGLPHAERAVAMLAGAEATPRWLEAQMLLGSMQGFAGRLDDADVTLGRAIAVAPSVPGGEARLPMLLEEAATVAQNRGDAPKAERMLRIAIETETRLSGPDNSGTVALMRQLALLLTNQGRVVEALAVFEDARRRVDAWPASPDRDLLTRLLLMLEGRARHAYGHATLALEMIDRSLALHADVGENPRAATILHLSRATVLTEFGRLDAAAAALAAADAVMRDFDLHSPDQVFNRAQAAIRLELARGDAPAALAGWTAYMQSSPPDLTAAWVLLLRAEIAWTAGEPELAAAKAQDALRRMGGAPATFAAPRLEMRARQVIGRARLSQGRAGEAVTALEAALALAAGMQDPEQGLERAGAGIDLGLALARLGEHDRARQLRDAARSVHARYSEVAETFAAPLRELEDALRRAE